MEHELFRKVVSTKYFKVPSNSKNNNSKTYVWENTQKMLWQRGVNGIKTGITATAGPCLATSITKEKYQFVIVVLSCKTMDARAIETRKLANWAA